MKTFKLIVLATVLAATPACKKKKEEAKTDPAGSGSAVTEPAGGSAAGSGSGSAAGSAEAPGSAAGSAEGSAAQAEDPNADWIHVYATHTEPKPNDPVIVRFDKFKVTKSNFDPAKVEGGTASFEIDLTSLKTDSEKRDAHLASADYIDSGKFATATVDVDNVKKKDGQSYTADAKIKFRDLEQKYPVTFEVVETKDDSIRIRGEHKFPRLDFKVGKAEGDGVAPDLTAKIQLTLKKS